MPETVGQHKNGCPKGKTQSRGPLSRRLLCIMFTDKRNAGLLADFFLGWHRHAKRGRKGEAGRWCVFSLAEILTGTGLSKNQWRDAKPWLEGAVRIVGGGNMGKRAIWVQPTAQLERFVAGAGDYPDKKAARRALEALRQAPVERPLWAPPRRSLWGTPLGTIRGTMGDRIQYFPLFPLFLRMEILIPLFLRMEILRIRHSTWKRKSREDTTICQGRTREQDHSPYPPAAGTVDLESLVELIYAAKVAQIDASLGILTPGPLTEEDILLEEQTKKHMLKKLKKDLQLYPSVPIPKGCKLVHPMCKDPIRWVSLSSKAKTDLYANKFLQYLENWKNGKAGKHAASVYGYGGLGAGNTMPNLKIPKCLYDDDPELAALDAEFAKSMAALDDLDEAA